MEEETLACKYAQALFELAVKLKTIKTIIEQLQHFLFFLNEEAQLSVVFKHPGISKKDKIELIENIVDKEEFESLLVAFLKLLIIRGRFGLINLIYENLKKLNDELTGRQVVFVESAIKLSGRDKKELEDKFSKILNKSVKLETTTKPSLLGGLKIVYDDTVFDASLRKQLQNLKGSIL